ncbi:MAG: 30S ribosomal protein S4 [bacterium]|nr:30S ribosomal protein S4 [bacterium]
MARYTDAKCRICRREKVKLFLKAERCLSPKCPIEKRGAVPPGQHGAKRRREPSNFGIQLREKQKAKRTYGVLERQFRRYMGEVNKQRGTTARNLFLILERRLDNVVYRLGLAPSRSVARQLVNHGHVMINNKKVDVPSYSVCREEVISLDKKPNEIENYQPPAWLARQGPMGKILRLPERDDIQTDIDEQLIAEYYSR